MKFQDLPVSVQEIAAKTLGEKILRPDDKKEPAELAREVMIAFTSLYEVPNSDKPSTSYEVSVTINGPTVP
ncbi:TPA: hypothetical protein ACOVFI_001567 [Citrobacter braakii]